MSKKRNLIGAAAITTDFSHRYMLSRTWDDTKKTILFICLNPSRANDKLDDNTIRRCINFADDWGYGKLYFGNLFSLRTPYVTQAQINDASPADRLMESGKEWPALYDNLDTASNETTDSWLDTMISESDMIVCGWGAWKFKSDRSFEVYAQILEHKKKPHCLGENADGSPKHPLYLSSATKLITY